MNRNGTTQSGNEKITEQQFLEHGEWYGRTALAYLLVIVNLRILCSSAAKHISGKCQIALRCSIPTHHTEKPPTPTANLKYTMYWVVVIGCLLRLKCHLPNLSALIYIALRSGLNGRIVEAIASVILFALILLATLAIGNALRSTPPTAIQSILQRGFLSLTCFIMLGTAFTPCWTMDTRPVAGARTAPGSAPLNASCSQQPQNWTSGRSLKINRGVIGIILFTLCVILTLQPQSHAYTAHVIPIGCTSGTDEHSVTNNTRDPLTARCFCGRSGMVQDLEVLDISIGARVNGCPHLSTGTKTLEALETFTTVDSLFSHTHTN
jgi:hypothetical protein